MKKTFLTFCAVALLTFGASQANASTVNLNSSQEDVLFAPEYSYTDYTSTFGGVSNSFDINGILAPNSKVVFTFSIGDGGTVKNTSMQAYADSETDSLYTYTDKNELTDSDASASALLQMSALLEKTLRGGSMTIENYTSASVDVAVFLSTLLTRDGATPSFAFSAQVSSIPLPAALPLFGLGIASLAGYRLRKKAGKAA